MSRSEFTEVVRLDYKLRKEGKTNNSKWNRVDDLPLAWTWRLVPMFAGNSSAVLFLFVTTV